MHIYDSKQWILDIDKIIKLLPELSLLQGKSVLITGATGLICSAVTDVLIRYNEAHERSIGILVAGRSEKKAKERFAPSFEKEYFSFIEYDASRPDNKIDGAVNFIIHGASNAYPAKIAREPVQTMLSNFLGVKGLLDYSVQHHIDRLLYVSSSEVYGKKEDIVPYSEKDYGYVDLLNSRNSYSVSKRAAETLCTSYADEYGANFVIVRPGHIYGPTASLEDNRVSSTWVYSAARGENIVMKSAGQQIRSYCYCLDCASAILKVLLNGQKGEAYNISNPDSVMTIRQIAELCAKYGNVPLEHDAPTETERAAFNPMSNSSLNADKLQNLGWHGLFDAETGVEHTVKILRDLSAS